MNRSFRQKINKAIETSNDTIKQLDLTDIFRALHQKNIYIFFSNTHGTFSNTDHILGHKTNLNLFKRTEIIPSIFFDHNGIKLNHRKSNEKKKKLHGG